MQNNFGQKFQHLAACVITFPASCHQIARRIVLSIVVDVVNVQCGPRHYYATPKAFERPRPVLIVEHAAMLINRSTFTSQCMARPIFDCVAVATTTHLTNRADLGYIAVPTEACIANLAKLSTALRSYRSATARRTTRTTAQNVLQNGQYLSFDGNRAAYISSSSALFRTSSPTLVLLNCFPGSPVTTGAFLSCCEFPKPPSSVAVFMLWHVAHKP